MTDPRAKCSDSDFIRLFKTHGPHETARRLGANVRNVFRRRDTMEKKQRGQINGPLGAVNSNRRNIQHPHRVELDVRNGIILVGSDAHIWPGPMSTAMRAFIKFCKEMKPAAVIMNGDVMDFPQISRHPPIGWENHPTVQQEIEAAQEQLAAIEKATFKARKVWTLGNHDSRFETRLATVAPEYARLAGYHLKDHFPLWEACWSCWVNDDLVIKHRFKGGDHAPFNNAVKAGKSMVTGHLHSAKVVPFTDYNGTRYGVDTGCMANPNAKAFVDYTEDNPKNWVSGFGVFTFNNGRLLAPELVTVFDEDSVQFRGKIIPV